MLRHALRWELPLPVAMHAAAREANRIRKVGIVARDADEVHLAAVLGAEVHRLSTPTPIPTPPMTTTRTATTTLPTLRLTLSFYDNEDYERESLLLQRGVCVYVCCSISLAAYCLCPSSSVWGAPWGRTRPSDPACFNPVWPFELVDQVQWILANWNRMCRTSSKKCL